MLTHNAHNASFFFFNETLMDSADSAGKQCLDLAATVEGAG